VHLLHEGRYVLLDVFSVGEVIPSPLLGSVEVAALFPPVA
jgi:hypothetical protein